LQGQSSFAINRGVPMCEFLERFILRRENDLSIVADGDRTIAEQIAGLQNF
jgi:hypothetical protein